MTAYGDESHRQFNLADAVRQQLEDLGDDIAGITGLRDDTLFDTDVSVDKSISFISSEATVGLSPFCPRIWNRSGAIRRAAKARTLSLPRSIATNGRESAFLVCFLAIVC